MSAGLASNESLERTALILDKVRLELRLDNGIIGEGTNCVVQKKMDRCKTT